MSGSSSDLNPSNNRQFIPGETEPSSKNYALSGKIMLAAIVVLFVVVFFLVLLHLYARWYLFRVQQRNQIRRRNRRTRPTHLVFYVEPNGRLAVPTTGLDATLLKSLPVFVYSPEIGDNMPECAVCLSEFEEGETGRVLPKCKHGFHTECIDMWFHNHSTCPLCRSPVEPVEPDVVVLVEQSEPGSSSATCAPVKVENRETTSLADRRKGIDVRIDVPVVAEVEFRLPSPVQGFRSPGSRLLQLKRILSMNRKSPAVSPSSGVGPSRLPVATEADLESAREVSAQELTRL